MEDETGRVLLKAAEAVAAAFKTDQFVSGLVVAVFGTLAEENGVLMVGGAPALRFLTPVVLLCSSQMSARRGWRLRHRCRQPRRVRMRPNPAPGSPVTTGVCPCRSAVLCTACLRPCLWRSDGGHGRSTGTPASAETWLTSHSALLCSSCSITSPDLLEGLRCVEPYVPRTGRL
jgi:hypothetical protein